MYMLLLYDIIILYTLDRCIIPCRHDFLGILEPYMMEEKKGLVDFLRTAVGCFRDLPRGHIINLAQHMQQVVLFISISSCLHGTALSTASCAMLCIQNSSMVYLLTFSTVDRQLC